MPSPIGAVGRCIAGSRPSRAVVRDRARRSGQAIRPDRTLGASFAKGGGAAERPPGRGGRAPVRGSPRPAPLRGSPRSRGGARTSRRGSAFGLLHRSAMRRLHCGMRSAASGSASSAVAASIGRHSGGSRAERCGVQRHSGGSSLRGSRRSAPRTERKAVGRGTGGRDRTRCSGSGIRPRAEEERSGARSEGVATASCMTRRSGDRSVSSSWKPVVASSVSGLGRFGIGPIQFRADPDCALRLAGSSCRRGTVGSTRDPSSRSSRSGSSVWRLVRRGVRRRPAMGCRSSTTS